MLGPITRKQLNATFKGGADNLLTGKYTLGFSANGSFLRSDFGIDAFAALVADDLLVPYRWMASRNIIDLHDYFERTVRDPDYRLPFQGINDIQRLHRLQFVATDKESLEPIYLEPDELSVVSSLKASC